MVSSPTNVVPFVRPVDPLAYEPGVTPFDRSNPDHIRAWNSMFAFGRSEQRFQALEDREGR